MLIDFAYVTFIFFFLINSNTYYFIFKYLNYYKAAILYVCLLYYIFNLRKKLHISMTFEINLSKAALRK